MYLTIKQQIKHLRKSDFENLRGLSHIAKNLYNTALYNIRQHYFATGTYLNYNDNYKLCKQDTNYKLLNSNMAQQILKEADGAFKSFLGLLELAKQNKYDRKLIKMPRYLDKDGFYTLIIGFVRLSGNKFILPYSNLFRKNHAPILIVIPPNVVDKQVKEIRVIPKNDASYFEVQYIYKIDVLHRELNKQKALAIDFGVNNLFTCATSHGCSFIVDGRRLKSINQFYNKQLSQLQSIKDKQGIKLLTKRQVRIIRNRNNRVNDYISKACRLVINFCLNNDIGVLVVGYNQNIKKHINLGSRNNQNFVNIPFGIAKNKLAYLCELYGINFVEQEESYTSKASFFDGDLIPVYGDSGCHVFSGRRLKRGLYQTSSGKLLNADVNGALNILRKSSAVGLTLSGSGDVDTPLRIRIA